MSFTFNFFHILDTSQDMNLKNDTHKVMMVLRVKHFANFHVNILCTIKMSTIKMSTEREPLPLQLWILLRTLCLRVTLVKSILH